MSRHSWDLDHLRCYYCDETADTIDHVVPQSILIAVQNSGDEAMIAAIFDRSRRLQVPCCRECNSLAGGVYDHTLADRRLRIAKKFERRYRRDLTMPDWSDTELMSLSDLLRGYVIGGLRDREVAQRRLRALRRT